MAENQTRRCEWCGDIAHGACGCQAEVEIRRLQSVVAAVNARCDHLGMRLGQVISERDAMRFLIGRAVAGYATDDAAVPTCVSILRKALEPNVGIEPPERSARMTG